MRQTNTLLSFFLTSSHRHRRLIEVIVRQPTLQQQHHQHQHLRTFAATAMVKGDPFKPASRVAGTRQDVWSIVNEAASQSEKPVVNMGQVCKEPQACKQASKEAILTGLTHTGLLRLQPSQVRTRCRQRRLGPGRMQSIFPHRRPTTFTKSHRRCLLALVRQTTRPDKRSHHHHGCQ